MRRFILNCFNRLWKLFTSVRLTVMLLLSLAVFSIIGTVIPQNESQAAYFQQYGEFIYTLLDLLDVFDMYHSWWFQFILLLLIINVVVCSTNRLSGTWKIVFHKKPSFNVSQFRNLPNKEAFTDNRSPEMLKQLYEPFVSREFGLVRVENANNGFQIFTEKWRWSRLGVYTVHLSIVLMLLGGFIGSMFGFEGFVDIPEGKTAHSIHLNKTGEVRKLDFGIRCDDFNISFYDSGAPSEYRSNLTILEQGKPVFSKDIIVNAPLRYKGINIFQSNYGALPPREITLNFTNKATGAQHTIKTSIAQLFDLPEGMGKFIIKNHRPSYDFRGHNLGETLVGILTPNNRSSIDVILPLRFPNFDKMRKGEFFISVIDSSRRYYTGLQVTKDPGVWVVYSGFIVMIIGCVITFYMSHQRICVEVSTSGKKAQVMVAGTANKNKLGMQNKIKKLASQLTNLK